MNGIITRNETIKGREIYCCFLSRECDFEVPGERSAAFNTLEAYLTSTREPDRFFGHTGREIVRLKEQHEKRI